MKARWELSRHIAAAIAVSGAVTGAAIAYQARHIAPFSATLECVDVLLPTVPYGLSELRLGFVSDTHIGPITSAKEVEGALSLLESARPDLLLLGGDYVSDSSRYIPDAAAVLGDYATALPFGAVAVLGNHDYSNDAPRVVALLEKRGIRVLRNESARVSTNSGDFWIAGIDDAILGTPDAKRAFMDIPAGAPVVALWHEPDWADETAAHGAVIQLSGHSHGGQVRLPILGTIAAPPGGRRFVSGLRYAADMPVYTTRGVGVYRPPIRLRCSPEVTLLTFA